MLMYVLKFIEINYRMKQSIIDAISQRSYEFHLPDILFCTGLDPLLNESQTNRINEKFDRYIS